MTWDFIYWHLEQQNSALASYSQSMSLYQQTMDTYTYLTIPPSLLAELCRMLGNLYIYKKIHHKTLDYYEQALLHYQQEKQNLASLSLMDRFCMYDGLQRGYQANLIYTNVILYAQKALSCYQHMEDQQRTHISAIQHATLYLHQGQAYTAIYDDLAAKKAYSTAITILSPLKGNPDLLLFKMKIHINLGKLYDALGNSSIAQDNYQHAIDLGSKLPTKKLSNVRLRSRHQYLGQAFLGQKNTPQALNHLHKVLKIDTLTYGRLPMAHLQYNLGNAYLLQQNKENATQHYQKAIALYQHEKQKNKRFALPHPLLVAIHEKLAVLAFPNHPQVIQHHKNALGFAQSPQNPLILARIQGRLAQAYTIYLEQALKKENVTFSKNFMQPIHTHYQEAIHSCTQYLAKKQKPIWAQTTLFEGQLYQHLGDVYAANAHSTRIYRQDLSSSKKDNHQAIHYYQQALTTLKLLAKNKKETGAQMTVERTYEGLAKVYLALEDYDNVLTIGQKYLAIDPNTPSETLATIHKHLGESYQKHNNVPKAIAHYKLATQAQYNYIHTTKQKHNKPSLAFKHLQLADIHTQLAGCYLKQQAYDNAIRSSQKAIKLFEQNIAGKAYWEQDISNYKALGSFCYRWGLAYHYLSRAAYQAKSHANEKEALEKARYFYQRAHYIQAKKLGPDHPRAKKLHEALQQINASLAPKKAPTTYEATWTECLVM